VEWFHTSYGAIVAIVPSFRTALGCSRLDKLKNPSDGRARDSFQEHGVGLEFDPLKGINALVRK
jgi:hypothetical protein